MNMIHENAYAVYALSNNLLYVSFKKGIHITLAVAQTIVQDRLLLQGYQDYNVICDISEITHIESNAREYLSHYGSNMLLHVALVSTQSTAQTMAEFYVDINAPTVSTVLFSSIEEAENYLNTLPK